MPFFAELPQSETEDEPVPRPQYFDHPWAAPQHWLPGTPGVSAVVARNEHTLVRLTFTAAYPRGAVLELDALLNPEGPDTEPLHIHHHRHGGQFAGDLRLGLLWPDGRRVESTSGWHPGHDGSEAPGTDDFHIAMHGGGGGGISWSWQVWLWPLPPAGPVEVFCRWDDRGIPETATSVDLTAVVVAAADAEELWPLPELPVDEETGWFAYSPPPGAMFTAVRTDEPAASGDGLDAGDEDG